MSKQVTEGENKLINQDNLIYSLNSAEKSASLISKEPTINFDFVEIPVSIIHESQEYTIKTIKKQAFHHSSIKSIKFAPNSKIEIIEYQAFAHSQIESIKIPSSVIHICECSFEGCDNLKTVEIPFDSNLLTIGSRAFSFTSIEKIFIPIHVKEICMETFLFCENFKKIEFHPN